MLRAGSCEMLFDTLTTAITAELERSQFGCNEATFSKNQSGALRSGPLADFVELRVIESLPHNHLIVYLNFVDSFPDSVSARVDDDELEK